MFEFIKEALGESLDELPTDDDVADYLEEFPIALIYFVDSLSNQNLNIFNIASKVYTDVAFGFTISEYARVLSLVMV